MPFSTAVFFNPGKFKIKRLLRSLFLQKQGIAPLKNLSGKLLTRLVNVLKKNSTITFYREDSKSFRSS